MATYSATYTNGGTLAYNIPVTADMETDGELIIDTGMSYDVVAVFQVQDASGINIPLTDAVVTYPAEGQVSLANGAATFTLTETDVVNAIVFRRR